MSRYFHLDGFSTSARLISKGLLRAQPRSLHMGVLHFLTSTGFHGWFIFLVPILRTVCISAMVSIPFPGCLSIAAAMATQWAALHLNLVYDKGVYPVYRLAKYRGWLVPMTLSTAQEVSGDSQRCVFSGVFV